MNSPTHDIWEAFYSSHLQKFKKLNQKQAIALCPFHSDKNPSFSIGLKEGLWTCHGPCNSNGNAIIFADKLHIPREALPGWDKSLKQPIEEAYSYCDQTGQLLYQVVRLMPKGFRQRKPDGRDKWIWNLDGVKRVLYKLPELIDSKKTDPTIYIAEGEKDVESLRKMGFTATCNSGGAGKWADEFSIELQGFLEAIIIADKDDPGRDHAQKIAKSLREHVDRIKIVEMPGDAVKDVSDWIDAGGTSRKLVEIANQAPLYSFPNSTSIYTEETEKKSGMKAISAFNLMSEPDQDINWAVTDLIPASSAVILSGSSGLGKSWMLLDLAIECSRGGTWLNTFPTTASRVLYIDEESSSLLIRRRLGRLLSGKGISDSTTLDLHFSVLPGLCLTQKESVQSFRKLLEEISPSIVIIDTLIRVFRGEENSATAMSEVFSVVKSIIKDFNCVMLFADHHRKMGVNMGGGTEQLLRGSSEKMAFVDALISLLKKDDTLYVEHSKSRYAEPVKSFAIKIEDSTEKATVLTYIGDASILLQKKRTHLAREVLDNYFLQNTEASRKTLIELGSSQGISNKVIDETLRLMMREGFLKKENRKPFGGRGGRQAYFIRLNSIPPQETLINEADLDE